MDEEELRKARLVLKKWAAYADTLPTKSARIRFLHSKGLSVNAVHKLTGIPYQQVRNVIMNPRKREVGEQHIIDVGHPLTLNEADLQKALEGDNDD
jgi:hypothetical protein